MLGRLPDSSILEPPMLAAKQSPNPSTPLLAKPLTREVDAVVCGGGPAGATFAALLAAEGRSVVVLERERFPRFHIGESLLPFNNRIFERLGVLETLRTSGAQPKMGARFYHQGSDKTRFVEFRRGLDATPLNAFQVKRAEFDLMLLDKARARGAEVHEETQVQGAILDERGRALGVSCRRRGSDATEEVRAKVVVDATGRDALLSRRLGERERDAALDRSAAFAHWSGFRREAGERGGDILVVTTPDGWWWIIPFSDGTASVGIVMPSKRFKARTGSVEELYAASVAGCPQVNALLEGHARTTEVHAIGDYSYRSSRISGDGFVSIGDSAMFLDPVFSSGVFLAMTAAELAADTVAGALRRKGRVDGRDFRRFERTYRRGCDRFSTFVHGFYQPHFLETFYAEDPPAWMNRGVTTTLAGGVFAPSAKARVANLGFRFCTHMFRLAQWKRGGGAFAAGTGIVEE